MRLLHPFELRNDRKAVASQCNACQGKKRKDREKRDSETRLVVMRAKEKSRMTKTKDEILLSLRSIRMTGKGRDSSVAILPQE
jgi:hypothetical protein